MSSPDNPPKIFISYSWDDDTHKTWVRELATRLRGDGVDVTLDQWHVRPGDQLPTFMEQAIRDNQFVLIVCTPVYKAKSDDRIGGAGYEGDVIQGEVFTHGNNRKFIPLLRRGPWKESAPTALLGKAYIAFNEGADLQRNYQTLLRAIYSDDAGPPPIGSRRDLSEHLQQTFQNLDLRGHEASVECVQISEDGGRIVTIDSKGQLRVWESATGACLRVLSTGNGYRKLLALDASGSKALALGTTGYPPRLWIYSLSSEAPPVVLEDDDLKARYYPSTDPDHIQGNGVTAVVTAPDWRLAVTSLDSGELSIWNLETAVKLRSIHAYNAQKEGDKGLHRGVGSMRIFRDGTKAVTLSEGLTFQDHTHDSNIKVWDLTDGKLLKSIPLAGDRKCLSYSDWTYENEFVHMCITSDESQIITNEKAGMIKVWDLQSGQIIREWSDKSSWRGLIECRGSILVSSEDSTIKIWDHSTGRLLDTRRYHSGQVNSLCLSSDGSAIISGSYDKTVKIRTI